MTELTTPTGISTGLIAVSVDEGYTDFEILPYDIRNDLHEEAGWRIYSEGLYLFRTPYKIEILGTVTEAEISFNVEPYVESRTEYKSIKIYKEYCEHTMQAGSFDNANDSFRSLLAFNGLHFVNPYGKKPAIENFCGEYEEFIQEKYQWQSAEDKIVNKLLIIKKLNHE